MKKTQRQIIIDKLKQDGFVSRNWALSMYISRLSAITLNLKHSGWQLEGFNEGSDYVYKVVSEPKVKKQVVEQLSNGHVRVSYQMV